jgi:AraC-like DNA-binding protein
MAPKCDVLMDYRAVERLDPEVLIRYGELVSAHLVAWGPRVDRLVAILPGGLPGILIAGAVPSLQPAFSEALNRPIRFLSDAESALAYLDRADAREALDETQQMIAESRGKAALIDRLRAQLAREPADASLQGIARVLGTSPRSLQRELRLLGTSFSDELRRVRVSTAADLLLHSDGKIDAIAVRVGLGTASRMSAVFRREVGLTPTELRARRR